MHFVTKVEEDMSNSQYVNIWARLPVLFNKNGYSWIYLTRVHKILI